MPYLSQHANRENFMEALLLNADRYQPIVEFTDKIAQNLTQLSWRESEWLATEISKANGSGFCSGIHAGISRALEQPAADPARQQQLDVLLNFAQQLNQAAHQIGENEIRTVRDAGWHDQTIEDVTGLVAIIKVYNILASGMGFGALPAPAFDEMGQATVEMGGYLKTFRYFMENAESNQTK